ncbi:MAG: hypothetical protein HY674_05995 [Chloroflexi bacterium]|nr:hypothetical protein [Chloroflexota bacterium]
MSELQGQELERKLIESALRVVAAKFGAGRTAVRSLINKLMQARRVI